MNPKKVVVAMSGGVDSSVAAALLKEKGFAVIGITMQISQSSSKDGGNCCGLDSIEDAKRVANRLEISHYVLNFRDIFKKMVIANFCEEYQEGKTPNPCIRCNQYIKFDALLKKAQALSTDYIATGHYARIEFDSQRKRYLLKKGIDSQKDQSYVLYTMTQEQLKQTLMPLGNLTKDRVREIAKEKGLPVANRPESQEICFIRDENYGKFLKRHIPEAAKPGPIVNSQGKVLGEHQGIILYTVGQRKRIGISAKEPLYVMAIDKAKNVIVVGRKEEIYASKLIAVSTNYISIEDLKEPLDVKAKIRYLHEFQEAQITPLGEGNARVKFKQPQWAMTPGQAVVFYNEDIVIGGGVISEVEK